MPCGSGGIKVEVVRDTPEPIKPDAVFPNNWVSFHSNGMAITYPMASENRRPERRERILEDLEDQYDLRAIFNLENFEERDQFLEGHRIFSAGPGL